MTDRTLHPVPRSRPLPTRAAALLLAAACHGGSAPSATAPRAPWLGAEVAALAADAWEGRETGTPGNDSTAAFLARRYRALGIASPLPGGAHPAGGGVYFGSVPDMAATEGTGLRLTGVTPAARPTRRE